MGHISSTHAQGQGNAISGPASPELSAKAKKASDAAKVVEDTVARAKQLAALVDKYQKSITDITGADAKSKTPPLENLQTIQATVQAILQQGQGGLLTGLATIGKSLDATSHGSAEANRSSLCKALDDAAGSSNSAQQDVQDAHAACVQAGQDAADESTALGSALSGLQNALQGVYSYFKNQANALAGEDNFKSLSQLGANEAKPDVGALIHTLQTGLPALKNEIESERQYRSSWEATRPLVQTLLKDAPAGDAPKTRPADVDQAFTNLDANVDIIKPKLGAWFAAIEADLTSSATSLDSTLAPVLSDPAKNSAAALGSVRDLSDKIASVQPVLDAWPPLIGYLEDGKPSNFNLPSTRKAAESVQTAQNVLRGAVARMHDALAGDLSQFETASVSLYYFTDVPRLMRALNENVQTIGGVAEAQANAAAQRKVLTETELELADAQASVNRYQKEVLDLQEQQRQLQAKLKSQDSQVSKLASRLKGAQDVKNQADADYQNAQAAQQQKPSDPTLAGDLRAASAKQTAAATKLSQTQSDYSDAVTQRDATQGQLNDSQNQSDSLPAKMQAAKEALSAAQTAVAQDRRKMLLAAQAESDAFAFARDNAPYLYAPAVASSSDPAKRVILYAFNDSKTVFMRGKRDDIAEVKRIIAEFDQPAPQARLTLWTFQINSEAGQKTNKKTADAINKSLEIIDEELGDSRALVNTTLSLLRNLINEQVRAYAALPDAPECDVCTDEADSAKFRRLNFYNPDALAQLRFSLETPDLKALRRLIPDPAGTTTLGEALLVLSLARPEIKLQVRNDFEAEIKDLLNRLPLSSYVDKSEWDNQTAALLTLTWHALGIWREGLVSDQAGLTSSELEICRALRTKYDSDELHRIADQLQSWYADLTYIDLRSNELNKEVGALEDRGAATLPTNDRSRLLSLRTLPRKTGPQTAEMNRLVRGGIDGLPRADVSEYDQRDTERLQLQARRDTIWQKSVEAVKSLAAQGISITDLTQFLSTAGPDGVRAYKVTLPAARLLVLKAPGLNGASPRVAAADQMLKEMIIALEDDLARAFVQPMIRGLRNRLTGEAKVSVGVLERESLLATNRGKARVDPRASAQLAVGTEEDILSGVQQLARLYATVQSGGALAALGALQQQPREPQPEIVALTTGNKFEVTPVFDPSGQALRFKFDFVASTLVQEPNGSTDPQFPRIERHTVNTEVQLSNLETREISRFESDARLGRPARYWGGLPILKDIPYVRPWVPLVGWFVRKAGSNAVAQQSVIFGQTTIYPTIGAMIDLLAQTDAADTAAQTAAH